MIQYLTLKTIIRLLDSLVQLTYCIHSPRSENQEVMDPGLKNKLNNLAIGLVNHIAKLLGKLNK